MAFPHTTPEPSEHKAPLQRRAKKRRKDRAKNTTRGESHNRLAVKILPLRNLFPRRSSHSRFVVSTWSGREDLNLRPPSPEPGALARLRYAPSRRHCNTEERGASMIPARAPYQDSETFPVPAQPFPLAVFLCIRSFVPGKRAQASAAMHLFSRNRSPHGNHEKNPNYTRRPLLFSQRSHMCGRSPLSLAPRHAILYYVGKISRGVCCTQCARRAGRTRPFGTKFQRGVSFAVAEDVCGEMRQLRRVHEGLFHHVFQEG